MAYKQQIFLTVLEAGKSKSTRLADFVSGESLFPGSETAVMPLSPHTAEGAKELCGLFSKVINTIYGLLPHDLVTSQRPTSKCHHPGVRFQHFGGTQTFSL